MKKKIFILALFATTLFSCEKDFLETPPLDQLTDETFWKSEENVRTFSYGFYPAYFTGYGSGFTWGNYFSGQSLNDDFAPTSPGQFTRNVPASGGGWTFSWVRKANIFIDRVQDVPMSDDAKAHWTGVGRFFRGMEYADLVNSFGDVPWYETELKETDTEELYKPRDSRTFVMDKVLADFRFAAENVRLTDGAKGLTVNRDVVLAFMSQVFLFEGTWQKYHLNNAAKAAEYLEASKWAAEQLISSGRYSLSPSYRGVFNSLNLAGNPEVILYRQYEPGMLTHALNSYNNKEPQTGASKDAIDSYLAEDGLPISISPLYQGDKGIDDVMTNRDPRITETFVSDELRLNGISSNYSTTGYATHKFLNEAIKDQPDGSSNLNPTDAPVIRYGEVLLNYAEATAELATVGGPAMTQIDLDKSINKLRARPGIGLPALQVQGNLPAVSGVTYDDPQRDPSVPSLIWEIRRERRVELMMEGFRLDDLRRWKKLEYTDTEANIDINRGAWISRAEYPKLQSSVVLTGAQEGYIIPATAAASQRLFVDPKVYLNPLPLDQIKLYADQGVELKQNPGW
ncbi:RagB/SusD family nutrient uptake outer membrane protein [uncultured Pontibacter sp.]|uniref:RagB/SusD family nutrient uptake outer membrane protein n=1 Tax=uncultured Pontibacter sp. TaxID=453356 RepID=UPI0026077408|nr:RagB/SusD family nutrient uptake outer membrane protein [uncultured Pontibacter sp.]